MSAPPVTPGAGPLDPASLCTPPTLQATDPGPTAPPSATSVRDHAGDLVLALLAGAEQAVVITDRDLRITHVSASTAQLLGITKEQMLQRPLRDFLELCPSGPTPSQAAGPAKGTTQPPQSDELPRSDRLQQPGRHRGPDAQSRTHSRKRAGPLADNSGELLEDVLTDALQGEGVRGRGVLVRPDGARLPTSVTVTPVFRDGGDRRGLLVIASDLTDQESVAHRLADSIQHFRAAFEKAPTGMALVSLAAGDLGRLLQANDALCAAVGRGPGDMVGLRMADLLHPEERPGHEAYLLRAMQHGETEPAGVERRFITSDGATWWGRKHTSLLHPSDGTAPRLLIAIQDVTGYRERQQDLELAALHDALTGLPNRTLVCDRLTFALDADQRLQHGVSVLFLDLDGFKAVNDTHGHAAGDALLQEVAHRLQQVVRAGDTVGRLGGDEFVIVCPSMSAGAVQGLTDRITAALEAPIELRGERGAVGVVARASFGSATSPHPGHPGEGQDGQALLEAADRAMYRYKRRARRLEDGRGGCTVSPQV